MNHKTRHSASRFTRDTADPTHSVNVVGHERGKVKVDDMLDLRQEKNKAKTKNIYIKYDKYININIFKLGSKKKKLICKHTEEFCSSGMIR